MLDLFRAYDESECGADGYPLAWHETIKHLVREQAEHRCVRCCHPYRSGEHGNGEWSPCDWECSHSGPLRVRPIFTDAWHAIDLEDCQTASDLVTNVEVPVFVEAAWRILTVHHLDGDKRNCRWWNLASLCQRCHLQIQGKVQMARIYQFEHTPWFRPYVAGYYAHVYLGENLTREQVDARLDELLALELAAA